MKSNASSRHHQGAAVNPFLEALIYALITGVGNRLGQLIADTITEKDPTP